MIEIRTLIDTGVVVSAVLLAHSIPRKAFDLAFLKGKVLISEATVSELDDVLRRPKFDVYLSEEQRLEFLAALVLQAEEVAVTEVINVCRDPKDNKVLELAISGAATHLLTGDADLLALQPFRGVSVLTPQSFHSSLATVGEGDQPS